MQYPKEFVALQVKFAYKIAEISNQPLADVLMDYTLLRQIFCLRVSRTIPNPLWDEFIHGLLKHPDPSEWAYQFHLRRMSELPEPRLREHDDFGCFSYNYPWREPRLLRLHFMNRDTSGQGALSRTRMRIRKTELTEMFRHIKVNHSDAKKVRGCSWLYNIEAYCRLFPPDYIKTARPVEHDLGFWTSWGQFIHRNGQLRESAAVQFSECLREQTTVDGCLGCFPYQRLNPICNIEVFYDFYGV